MAILNSCPGLEVKVVANNEALKEHADLQTNDAPKTITHYVEVNSEGAFEVHAVFTNDYTCRFGVRIEIRLDGHEVYGSLYRASQL